MEIFNLIVDQKISLWERSYVTVEADSLGEAIKKCRDGDCNYEDTEIIYESRTDLGPTREEPSTLEIFEENNLNQPVFTNTIYV